MATDSTLEDTDPSPDEGREETSTRGTPSPPRPPRPGKRSKGSGRIPIPLPQSRPDFEAVEVEALDHAPPVNLEARQGAAFPLVTSRERLSSEPEESFADLDADLADHAPAAPLTPRRGKPTPFAAASEATPPRGTPLVFRPDDDVQSEPEPTIVGKVSENLLELSSAVGGDENTRAFTAPRELIELARRKREERLQAAGAAEADHSKVTARPQQGGAADGALELKVPGAPNLPLERLPGSEDVPDASSAAHAPATEVDPASRPARASRDSAPDSGPVIEIDPASELSPSTRLAVLASTGRHAPISEPVEGAKKPSSRHWLLLFALFVVVGVLIARWREIATLFR